ncbi:MAG: polysaccharide biosynthesis tyrosine autokinase [Brevefilum sp.]|nr:polysaccharide biosynthesis tyrosine autokinase [Brevefilum sp.]MDT8382078.1 polysaccharide biosynthesis tyrosine autokinase [Brevefilum sp.]
MEFNISSNDPLFATEEEILQRFQFQDELDQIQALLELYQEIYTQLVVMGEPMQNENSSSIQIARLERTLDLYEQFYFTSLSSLENINLTQAQSTPNVVQVEPAVIPSGPISPRPFQSATLYAAVGLLITGGVAFLVEYLDDTIKTPDEVKSLLQLPVIGLVGDMEEASFQNKGNLQNIYVAQHPRSPISEAFRSLRTSLEFYSVDSPLEILSITSSGPEEGKTTIAANLSVILASGNKKVLLLDADLRRPNIHKMFSVINRVGLSDLLRGNLDYSEVIHTFDEIANLSIITSGSLPPNPAELVASKKMNSIIDELKSSFDMIIIDTPPAIVTDS